MIKDVWSIYRLFQSNARKCFNEPFNLGSLVKSLSTIDSMNSTWAEMNGHDQFFRACVRDFRRCLCLKPCSSLISRQIQDLKYCLNPNSCSNPNSCAHLCRNCLIREIMMFPFCSLKDCRVLVWNSFAPDFKQWNFPKILRDTSSTGYLGVKRIRPVNWLLTSIMSPKISTGRQLTPTTM